MNVNELTNVTIGGICTADYPDFVDAYIESADPSYLHKPKFPTTTLALNWMEANTND